MHQVPFFILLPKWPKHTKCVYVQCATIIELHEHNCTQFEMLNFCFFLPLIWSFSSALQSNCYPFMWHKFYHLFHSRSRNLFLFNASPSFIFVSNSNRNEQKERTKTSKAKKREDNSKRKHMHLTANSIFIIDLFIRFHYIIEIRTDLPNWFQIQHRMRNVQTRQEFSSFFRFAFAAFGAGNRQFNSFLMH